MSLETSVTLAARFLALSSEEPVYVRDELRNFVAACEATILNANGKANRLKINGAHAGLRECQPWRQGVEAAASLAEYLDRRAKASASDPRIKFDRKKLAELLGALPPGDEREYFQLQLEESDSLGNKPENDPGWGTFAAKTGALRDGLRQTPEDLPRLKALVAAVRDSAASLTVEAAKARAAAELAELAGQVEQCEKAAQSRLREAEEQHRREVAAREAELAAQLERARAEKDRLEREAAELVRREREAAELIRREREAAEKARLEREAAERLLREREAAELARRVREAEEKARREAEAAAMLERQRQEHSRREREAAELARRATEAEAARQQAAIEKIAMLRVAVDERDVTRALAVLPEARTLVLGLRQPDAAERFQVEIRTQVARLDQLQKELREAEALKKNLAEKMETVPPFLVRREFDAAEAGLADARKLVEALGDRAAREAALADLAALAERLRAAKVVPPPAQPDQGQLLLLVPKTAASPTGPKPPTIRFVARDRFLLGRQEKERAVSRADFIAPESFKQVGRGNVLLTRKDDQIVIQDGDGEKKSTNGSKLDNTVLTTVPTPTKFERERTIVMGQVFSLGALHLPGDAPAGPAVQASTSPEMMGRTVVISSFTGAMRFTPKADAPLPLHAVWLFTDATIGSAPGCAVPVAGFSLADFHARIHFWEGGFWVENLRAGAAVRLGEHILARNETRALRNADVLHLGPLTFAVTIEA